MSRMKTPEFVCGLFAGAAIATAVFAAHADPRAFALHSAAFAPRATIPHRYSYQGYGCTGENASPELDWRGAPAGTKTFVLTVFDPDARAGRGWWHWVVFNIPAKTTGLPAGAGSASGYLMPRGATQGRNDFQTVGYGGPCPPGGEHAHHYHFTLYALDEPVAGMSELASGPTILHSIRGHVLAKAELVGLFRR